MSNDYISVNEAAALLNISRWAMRRRIMRGLLTAHTSPLDLRRKLLLRRDVEAFASPRPLGPTAGRQRKGGAMSHVAAA